MRPRELERASTSLSSLIVTGCSRVCGSPSHTSINFGAIASKPRCPKAWEGNAT